MKGSRIVKRVFETSLAIVLFLATLPLQAVIAIFKLLFDGLPVFFRQERVGENNKIYEMLKFRTMKVGSQMITEEVPLDEDERVTFLGYWLRKFCLDELPQLWNVIRGDIYLIGTRSEINDHDKIFRYHPGDWRDKLKMPHGISGYWQAYSKGAVPIYARATIDEERTYYKRAGFLSDLVLIVLTPLRLIVGFKSYRNPTPIVE